MKRLALIGVVILTGLGQTACVAVSAKDINMRPYYTAVATPDGKIYVVDTKKTRAWPVTMLQTRPADAENADD